MEYLMTYGWAILVVIIIGVVLWQIGIFNPVAVPTPGRSGFVSVAPLEYGCKSGLGATDQVFLVAVNGAGGTINNVSIKVGSATAACNPSTVGSGIATYCSVPNVDCGAENPADRYSASVSIEYTSPTNILISSSGNIWGPAS